MIPPGARRLGVLNNFSRNNVFLLYDNLELLPCNPDSLVEYVAMAFADEGLFDEVVVLDSCLYTPSDTSFHELTREEVCRLCEVMNVDLLYVCDFASVSQIKQELIRDYIANEYIWPRRYLLSSHFYAPTRNAPLHSFVLGGDLKNGVFVDRIELDKQLSQLYFMWGQLAVRPFIPQWDCRERSFFTSPRYGFREATTCVRDGDWECALAHWKSMAQSGNKHYRLYAAYNEALYWEMCDSIDHSLDCLKLALTFAGDTSSVDVEDYSQWLEAREENGYSGEYPFTNYQRILMYEDILKERQKEIQKLNLLNAKKQ